MQGFKPMNCVDLIGVAPEPRGIDVRRGGRTFYSLEVREVTGGARPFTEGLDIGELVGREQRSCRDHSERATEPRRLAQRAHRLVGPGNAGCEDQGEEEPRTKPHSSEAQ